MRLFPAELAVGDDHFADLFTDRSDWVQGREWLLEDHADPASTNRAELVLAEANEFTSLELDRAFNDCLLAAEQRNDRHRRYRLPRARLTNNREAFTGSEVEGNAIHNIQHTAAGAEADGEVFHL